MPTPLMTTSTLLRLLLVTVLCGLTVPVMSADKEKFGTLPEPPAPVKNYQAPPPADETIPEPEVVITTRGEEQREEHRIGGRLYMVKVTPKNAPPYYLYDPDGRGKFVKSDFLPTTSPPLWVIKRF